MNLTDEQKAEFEKLSKALIKWMAENVHPHTTVVLDAVSSQLYEGQLAVHTHEYLVD